MALGGRLRAAGRGAQRPHQHADGLAQRAFVQLPGHVVGAAQVQHQVVERDLAEVQVGGGAQHHAQAAADGARLRVRGQRQVGRVAEVLGTQQLQRPQPHRARGAELAVGALPDRVPRAQARAARQGRPHGEVGVVGVVHHADHRHRGRGREEVRIDDVEQVAGEARVLGIELEVDARRQEGRGLDQALDVGVGDLLAFDAEPVGDLRKGARELGRALAEVAQFLLVQAQQSGIHRGATSRWPAARARPAAGGNRRAAKRDAGPAASWLLGRVLDLDASFFQVDPAAHEELQRHRLRPQHAADLQADAVVRVQGGAFHDEFHFESA